MKKQLHKLRRFFARTGGKKLNAATARDAASVGYEDEDNSSRLSGAFIIVLVLHVIALVGVFFYSRAIKGDPGVAAGGKANANALPPAVQEHPPAAPSPGRPAPPMPAASAALVRDTERPPATTPTPNPRPNGRTYTVKSGDNLSMIATVLGVRTADLRVANALTSDDVRVGQELVVPVKYTPEPHLAAARTSEVKAAAPERGAPTIYAVKKGDTLVKIAREHGVSYEELTKLNKISDPKKIQLNQKIKIPAKK